MQGQGDNSPPGVAGRVLASKGLGDGLELRPSGCKADIRSQPANGAVHAQVTTAGTGSRSVHGRPEVSAFRKGEPRGHDAHDDASSRPLNPNSATDRASISPECTVPKRMADDYFRAVKGPPPIRHKCKLAAHRRLNPEKLEEIRRNDRLLGLYGRITDANDGWVSEDIEYSEVAERARASTPVVEVGSGYERSLIRV